MDKPGKAFDETLHEISAPDTALLVSRVFSVDLIPAFDKTMIIPFSSKAFSSEGVPVRNTFDPVCYMRIWIIQARFFHMQKRGSLNFKACDIISLRKTSQELGAIVDELADAFA